MPSYKFSRFIPPKDKRTPFEKMLELFLELLVYTSGDVDEALDWMKELDKTHHFTTDDYTLEDFIDDLHAQGFVSDPTERSQRKASGKTEQIIRRRALDQIFGKLKKGERGNHTTRWTGNGEEQTADRKQFEFGDRPEQIDFTASLRNAQINHGMEGFQLSEKDLEIVERTHKTQTSTVLMIDISHSMILYGEDRITPAKKVAMALSELIMTRYPKDSLNIVVFGNDAWEVSVEDLPYLKVGPYHTNTVAGLELAIDILRRRRASNKQILMITDGKPSCILENGEYYMNSFGLDPKIVNKTLNLARECRKIRIPITTFMIAQDPYLLEFIEEFTAVNRGKAFYSDLKGLGHFVFQDFENNRRKSF